MTRWKLAAAVSILVACDGGLTSPDNMPSASAAPALIVIAMPGQLVTLVRAGDDAERAWVQGRIVLDVIAPDGTAEMDGAILVVSAADGPMPQTDRNAETLQINIQSGGIDADGIIHFAGAAVVRDENGERAFDIAGSARREAGNPDCLIWDILGSNVYDGATFEAEVVLLDHAGVWAPKT